MRTFRALPSFLFALLLPCGALASAPTTHVAPDDLQFFTQVNEALSSVMTIATECRTEALDVYPCVCAEANALKRLDASITWALRNNPEWADQVLEHNGTALQMPSLLNQVRDIRNNCR